MVTLYSEEAARDACLDAFQVSQDLMRPQDLSPHHTRIYVWSRSAVRARLGIPSMRILNLPPILRISNRGSQQQRI